MQFLDDFVSDIGRDFKTFGLQAFEPEAEAVDFPIQDLHPTERLVEDNEKHWIENRHLDIEFDQRGQVIDSFLKVDRFGVEVHFSTLTSGRIIVRKLQKKREQSIGDQASALNMGLEHLRFYCVINQSPQIETARS